MRSASLVGILLSLTLAAGASGQQDWLELRFDNFILYAHTKESVARVYVRELRRFESLVTSYIPGLKVPRHTRNKIYVFASKAELEQFQPYYEGQSRDLHAWLQNEAYGNYITLWHGLAGTGWRFAAHEYFHVLANEAYPQLPRWAHEGLADFLSFHDIDDRTAKLGLDMSEYRSLLRRQGFMPLAEFFAVGLTSQAYLDAERRKQFYAQAWLLTHYLLSTGESVHGSFAAYARLIESGLSADAAFAPAFHARDANLLARLEDHLESSSWGELSVELPREANGGDVALRVVGAGEMWSEFAELVHGRHPEHSELCESYLAKARQDSVRTFALRLLEARHWNATKQSDRALEVLEELASWDGLDRRESRDLAIATIEVELYGSQARRLDEGAPAQVVAARAALLDWLQSHSGDTWARGFYGSSFRSERGAPFEAAIAALELSVKAQPDFTPFQLERLGLLYRSGQPEAALTMLGQHFAATESDSSSREFAELRLVEEAARSTFLAVRDSGCLKDCEVRLDSLRPILIRPAAIAYLESTVASLRSNQRVQSQYTRYNQAVELANHRKLQDADRMLETLEGETLDQMLRAKVSELRRMLRSQLRRN